QIVEVRGLIKEIAEERTVVLSTHILQEVQVLCDHIWMINEGSMVFSGPLREFDNYIQPRALTISVMNITGVSELKAIEGVLSVDELGGTRYRIHYSDPREVTDRLIAASYTKN